MSTSAAPPNTLGVNIRNAREARQVTQLALAHLIGWTGADAGAQISRFENGTREPRFSTLQRIADALGVSLDALTKRGRE